jgi:GMP synthase-like glutamine amidotransferase
MLLRLFLAVAPDLEYETFDVHRGVFPAAFHADELYLIPGSRDSAYDDTPRVRNLIRLVRDMDAAKVKMAGICFGHQIIARALGGRVEKARQGWGTGLRRSTVRDLKASAYFPKGTVSLLYNHHDQVTALPPQAVCFAQSDFCPFEGFYVEDRILTFQGHPEYTPDYSRYLLLHHAGDEPEEVKTNALASLNDCRPPDSAAVARWLVNLLRTKTWE